MIKIWSTNNTLWNSHVTDFFDCFKPSEKCPDLYAIRYQAGCYDQINCMPLLHMYMRKTFRGALMLADDPGLMTLMEHSEPTEVTDKDFNGTEFKYTKEVLLPEGFDVKKIPFCKIVKYKRSSSRAATNVSATNVYFIKNVNYCKQ